MTEIPSSTAKEQLVKMDKMLSVPHILIGGLAVQQYHPTRSSRDIDLICDDKTAKELINKLYPTKHYDIKETNEDDFRPAYVITSKKNKDKVIFIGPKITERDPYNYIDWDNLKKDAVPFCYKKLTLNNIRIPRMEALAFTKFLSFINRIEFAKEKGEQDLFDFINLSNNTDFRTNYLVDLIRNANCADYIKNRLGALTDYYSTDIWYQSSLYDILELMNSTLFQTSLQITQTMSDIKFNDVYTTDKSLLFYETVASLYDKRNTRFLNKGHQLVIKSILDLLPSEGSIIDIGCGTGRQIAAYFIHNNNISWLGIDGSQKMLDQFQHNTQEAKMNVQVLHEDITTLDWKKVSAADLCIICFTLTSISSIECINNAKDLVKPGGYLLIADIHPARINRKPYYEYEFDKEKWIALKLNPVYPDKIMEYLLQHKFELYSQKSIAGNSEEEFAFISIFRRESDGKNLNEVSSHTTNGAGIDSRFEPKIPHIQSNGIMVEHVEEYFKKGNFQAALRFGRCISRVLWTGGRYSERIRLGRIMFELGSVLKDKEVQALALIDDLGWTYVMQKNYKKAEENIISGLKIAEEMNDFYLIAKAKRHLGGIAIKLSRFEDAEKILQDVEEIAKNIINEKKRKEMVAGVQYGMAELYMDMGKIEDAEIACDKAKKIFEEINDKERLIMRFSRFGRICLDKNRNYEALSAFLEGLDLARSANMDDEIVRNLIGISKTYLNDGRWVDAKPKLEEAYKIAESIGLEIENEEIRNLLQKY